MFQDGSDQSGSKARSWAAQRPGTQGAPRKILDQRAAGQSAVSEDSGMPLDWALDDRAPERRDEPADGKED